MVRTFKLRRKVDNDLVNIYAFSVQEWGTARAEEYIRDINSVFHQLAGNPSLGREYHHIKSGLRAFNVVSHIVFYKPTSYGVAVIRVLHHAVDVPRHL